jgi:uncharacterized membrane protein
MQIASSKTSGRLFFIDAMRAWAILMMLQGHFIDGLLDPAFRNPDNPIYAIWLYFRGITAPVFFTVSGFIFTYLLVRAPQTGFNNPRVKKGIKRGLQLLLIGYLLRLNIFGLFMGELYNGFYLVDVLHCIGLSLLTILSLYLLVHNKNKIVFPAVLLMITLLLFSFEPLYKEWSFGFLPELIANYFTKSNGSVFTIIPWLGYAAIGAFISLLFTRFKTHKKLYLVAIPISTVIGLTLILFSSDGFAALYKLTGVGLFQMIEMNNYLFIRLGDVFVVFAIFMLLRKVMNNKTILAIGASTLSIYVIHFVLLYGSFTGLGLYRFFHHGLYPSIAIPGAILFMIACTYFALQYGKHETVIKLHVALLESKGKSLVLNLQKTTVPILKELHIKVRIILYRLFGFSRS